jgi:hypothetical protein
VAFGSSKFRLHTNAVLAGSFAAQFCVTLAAARLRDLMSSHCQADGGRRVVQFEECSQEMEDGTEPGIGRRAKSHDLASRSSETSSSSAPFLSEVAWQCLSRLSSLVFL